jgi:outer membrane protein assembly factor BamB
MPEEFDPPTKWDEVLTAAAVGADGTVYTATRHGLVIALTPAGKVRWTRQFPGDFMGPANLRLAPDGTLYVINREGLHAVTTASGGPAADGWPQYQGNARGTGRAPAGARR